MSNKTYRTLPVKDLQPGMLTDHGLIVAVYLEQAPIQALECPCLRVFDLNDAYHGQVIIGLDAEDVVTILHETGTSEYRQALFRLMGTRTDALTAAENDIDLLRAYVKVPAAPTSEQPTQEIANGEETKSI